MPTRSTIRRASAIASLAAAHCGLQFDGAFDGLHGAGELDQHAVAHHLDDAPAMPVDQRVQNRGNDGIQRGERAGLVACISRL